MNYSNIIHGSNMVNFCLTRSNLLWKSMESIKIHYMSRFDTVCDLYKLTMPHSDPNPRPKTTVFNIVLPTNFNPFGEFYFIYSAIYTIVYKLLRNLFCIHFQKRAHCVVLKGEQRWRVLHLSKTSRLKRELNP